VATVVEMVAEEMEGSGEAVVAVEEMVEEMVEDLVEAGLVVVEEEGWVVVEKAGDLEVDSVAVDSEVGADSVEEMEVEKEAVDSVEETEELVVKDSLEH
jgi:hypothetical protein